MRAWNAEGRSPSWSTPALATTDAPASTVPAHARGAHAGGAEHERNPRRVGSAERRRGSAITSYSIRWRIGSGAYTEQVGLTALSYDIVGLDEDTEYSVSVEAGNDVGFSPWSAEAMESTDAPPVPPAPLFLILDNEEPADGHVRAYTKSGTDGIRAPTRDIPNLGDANWVGLASDATHIWVLRTDAPVRALAYDHSGVRQAAADLVPAAFTGVPTSLAVNSTHYFIGTFEAGLGSLVDKFNRADDTLVDSTVLTNVQGLDATEDALYVYDAGANLVRTLNPATLLQVSSFSVVLTGITGLAYWYDAVFEGLVSLCSDSDHAYTLLAYSLLNGSSTSDNDISFDEELNWQGVTVIPA